jgi:hypothetical protein
MKRAAAFRVLWPATCGAILLRQAKRSDDTILPAALKFLASPLDQRKPALPFRPRCAGIEHEDLTPAPQSQT